MAEDALWPHVSLDDVARAQPDVRSVAGFLRWHPSCRLEQGSLALLNRLPPSLQPLEILLRSSVRLQLDLESVTVSQVHHILLHHGHRVQSLVLCLNEPPNVPLTALTLGRLATAIGHCVHATKLHIHVHHPQWRGRDIDPILHRLQDSNVVDFQLHASSYSGDLLSDSGSYALIAWLFQVPVMSFAWIDAEPYHSAVLSPAATRLAAALAASRTLRTINLSQSKMLLEACVQRPLPRTLRTLRIEYPHAPTSYTTQLKAQLAAARVMSLDLSWHPSTSVVTLLGPNLAQLTTLNLSHCYLMIQGSRAVGPLLPTLRALQHLILSANDLFDDGITAILPGLVGCSALESLRLDRNQLTDRSLAATVKTCRLCKRLRHIDLSDNLYTDETVLRLHKKPTVISRLCAITCPDASTIIPTVAAG
ncbi:hypothetical protein SPRG_13751 [Saprolegnia parasitica CBS 223.65]|uniref:Uncharacterized protein n=1 Tax=Saprolegnia parasitica (strain CBS 223.65) TaxID=695850 RepID=A0A067BPE2_SAPPC|nr:hypothetical protein SPRG_13751 [Saprolegnia parasitica CBS 223.65]KDO20369.1 hypothetical protein SPRG_13751 [Saprolegnia parasitica CBS 223.65]|eukprot:XP_012208897.1 hypothetical protein SPRG_13751 [Saprolegnia parasitica CBS 223.65]